MDLRHARRLSTAAVIVMLAGCGGSQLGTTPVTPSHAITESAASSDRAPESSDRGPIQKQGLETIPLTIVNATGKYADANVFFYVAGQGIPPGDKWYHGADASGKLELNKPTGGHFTANYNFNLAKVSKIEIPTMRGARLYVSFNKPILLDVPDNGIPLAPSGNDSSERNVNYNTMWDFMEWTYQPSHPMGAGLGVNTSSVDGANIPMEFRVVGANPASQPIDETRGFKPGGFSKFLASLEAQKDFSRLILPNTQRVLSPYNGMADGAPRGGPVFSKTYLDGYINAVWKKYTTEKLTTTTNIQGDWEGQVVNGRMVFTQVNGSPKLDPIVFEKPTTDEAFRNVLTCVSGCSSSQWQQGDAVAQFKAALPAAILRSHLLH